MKSVEYVDPEPYLHEFAEYSKNSKEYQGHGWGLYYLTRNGEKVYHAINPVWSDDLTQFSQTTYLLAHARSAFRDEGITLSNNMPFLDPQFQFVFNGELHGVKVKSNGSTGAMKLFNLFRRLNRSDPSSSLERTMQVINKRTDYIRASNIIIGNTDKFYVYSQYGEDPNYFTLHQHIGNGIIMVSSEPFGSFTWEAIPTGEVVVL